MEIIRLLIVDDSFIVREVLREMISKDPSFEVVGVAENGKEGVQMAKELSPDFITMDINMPVMNGLDAIDCIMSECPSRILVISSIEDSKVAFDACSRGAIDVFSKADLDPDKASKLTDKIKAMADVKVNSRVRKRSFYETPLIDASLEENDFKKIIAIACSTGGPKALAAILPDIPPNFRSPIVIAQHIEDGFLDGLVEWLGQVASCPVEKGKDGERIRAGRIYICPSATHMQINASGYISMVDRQPTENFRPNCDRVLSSIAESFKDNVVGVILSGMAEDGVKGIESIKKNGGFTLAQDKETSVIFGMNRKAIESGFIDKVLSLDEIGFFLAHLK